MIFWIDSWVVAFPSGEECRHQTGEQPCRDIRQEQIESVCLWIHDVTPQLLSFPQSIYIKKPVL